MRTMTINVYIFTYLTHYEHYAIMYNAALCAMYGALGAVTPRRIVRGYAPAHRDPPCCDLRSSSVRLRVVRIQ
jgi:hypothetical protein